MISRVGRCVGSLASLDLKVHPLPVPALDGRISQPRFGVPVRNNSVSLVTSKIAGAPSTSGTREKLGTLEASVLSALTPLLRLFQVALSFQSRIMRCARNVSSES